MRLLSLLPRLLLGFNLSLFSLDADEKLEISYPATGDVLEGIVEIRGSVPPADFSSARMQYSYLEEKLNWLLTVPVDLPVKDEELVVWDTSTIANRHYQFRLIVRKEDEEREEVIIPDVVVANYSPLPAAAAGMENAMSTREPTTIKKTEVVNTQAPLPDNPAAIDAKEIRCAILTGGLVGILFVIVIVLRIAYLNLVSRK